MKRFIFFLLPLLIFPLASRSEGPNAFLSPDRWPCREPGCRETCRFSGKIDGKKDRIFTLETHFYLSPGGPQLRTKALVDTHYWLVGNVVAMADETAFFGPEQGRIRSYDNNTRLIVGGESGEEQENVEWQGWSRLHFNWDTGSTESYLIQGKSLQELNSLWPEFSTHWPLDRFFDNWQEDFESAGPHRRKDYDVTGFDESAGTAGFLSFFLPRFLKPGEVSTAQLILGKENEGKPIPLRMNGKSDANSGFHVFSTDLRIGGLYSPKNDPTRITVDPVSRQIVEIRATFTHEFVMGTYKALLKAEGCVTEH